MKREGNSRLPKKDEAVHDSELRKGAVESDLPDRRTPVSMAGQLPHRTDDELIKQFDSDFPEPGGNPEHTGEPEENQ